MFGYLQGQNKNFNLIDLVQRRNRNNSLNTSFIKETVTTREQNFGLLHYPPLEGISSRNSRIKIQVMEKDADVSVVSGLRAPK